MIEKELPASDKISQKLVDVAQWYLALSKTKEECERNVIVARDSWNIACLGRELIDFAVKEALNKYRDMFSLNDSDIKELEKNIRLISNYSACFYDYCLPPWSRQYVCEAMRCV